MNLYHVIARPCAWDNKGAVTQYKLDNEHTLSQYQNLAEVLSSLEAEWEESDVSFIGEQSGMRYVACWPSEDDENCLVVLAVEGGVETFETK